MGRVCGWFEVQAPINLPIEKRGLGIYQRLIKVMVKFHQTTCGVFAGILVGIVVSKY